MLSLWTVLQSRAIDEDTGISITGYALLAALIAVLAMYGAVKLGGALDARLTGP